MDAKAYEGSALDYVLAKPDGFTPDAGLPLVVLLHGFGANMYDLAGLASVIDATGYVYAFPNGPHGVQLGPGAVGYSWATGRPGMAPADPNAPSTDELLDTFLSEIASETGAQPGRIVLGGFSQGGGLALTHGLPRPDAFSALAVLSGFFRDHDAVRPRLPAQPTQPVFVAHGTHDPVVPIDAGRSTRAFLQELGYSLTYNEYPMAHEISPAELGDLIAWLHEVMPPGPAS
ncbi:MAG TPA: phospholipase [Dehalococcoidia bacterium]|nr:phospholipase [Dehalococcoidia bacterium]